MARIDDLLLRIPDPQLRAELTSAIAEVRRTRDFGLVFESHLPETCRLPSHPIRRGVKATTRSTNDDALYLVASVNGPTAKLVPLRDTEGIAIGVDDQVPIEMEMGELVVVAEFGDPIYPGLKRVGSVSGGGDKPAHLVINGENHHALEALQFTHAGKVDCVYIDPPYNTGARDWKYNNDYVDDADIYRHSKWLAFMERRLKLAKRLLNPEDAVLIVTIDEKEYLRLGMLLEQTFPEASIQMVSATVNPKGASRPRSFARVDEFVYFAMIGDAQVPEIADGGTVGKPVRWPYLRRSDSGSFRGTRPRQFYPVFVDPATPKVVGVGDPIEPDVAVASVTAPEGLVAVWPIRDDGVEMEWGLTGPSLLKAAESGFVRATPARATLPDGKQSFVISYLTAPSIKKVEAGEFAVVDTRPDGSKIVVAPQGKPARPRTVWQETSHSAGDYGTKLLNALLPGRRFPFPKSLYAVEDALRLFVGARPEATVLDFFAGSGTTAHAVMRLNRQDGGRRRSISVTNNEVSADEQRALRANGLRPGDANWEVLGICDHITNPRITGAVTGRTPDGELIAGDYKFTDEFPMAEGLDENVEFLSLTYEALRAVAHHRSFEAIAPLLWLKAGARGRRIETPADDFAIADAYAILFDPDCSRDFLAALQDVDVVRTVFVITDDDRAFQMVCSELPAGVEAVRLYSSYLMNFTINAGRE